MIYLYLEMNILQQNYIIKYENILNDAFTPRYLPVFKNLYA